MCERETKRKQRDRRTWMKDGEEARTCESKKEDRERRERGKNESERQREDKEKGQRMGD